MRSSMGLLATAWSTFTWSGEPLFRWFIAKMKHSLRISVLVVEIKPLRFVVADLIDPLRVDPRQRAYRLCLLLRVRPEW